MNANLTPPATKTKTDATSPMANTKPPKAAKPPKVVDPNAPKKERAPRKDVGIVKDGIIRLTPKAEEVKFRGKRADNLEILKKHEGKKVTDFYEALKAKDTGKGGGPASWFRWFVVEGLATVEKPSA